MWLGSYIKSKGSFVFKIFVLLSVILFYMIILNIKGSSFYLDTRYLIPDLVYVYVGWFLIVDYKLHGCKDYYVLQSHPDDTISRFKGYVFKVLPDYKRAHNETN